MIKILAIDDNSNNLVVLSALFSSSFPDALIITALSGREGIEKALVESPDVILLDLVMPIMDGIETCRRLKEDNDLKLIPVIMITATQTDSKTRTKALETGVEAFLSKPVDEAELTAQVSSMIRLKQSENHVRLEKERLEEQVRQRTHELENELEERQQLEEALKQALEKAESGNRLKTAFMNNISHEVRTPLNGILGFSNLITQPDITLEEKVQYYSLIKTSSNRLLDTITSYMDISMIASGNMEVKRKPFDLHKILNQLYDQFQPLCTVKNIGLHLNTPAKIKGITIQTDAALFQKILTNLLDNAAKFTHQGKIIFGYEIPSAVTTGLPAKESGNPVALEFYVKDTGIGISREYLSIIFDSFNQEELCPTRGHEGSGLGLTIAQGLVRLLGGEIRVVSAKDKGSTFFFTIPSEGMKEEGTIPEAISTKVSDLGSPVILVAEDDMSNVQFIEVVLRKTAITLLVANNGQEAVEQCRAHPGISLVLMDIKMPVMDGLEATREIKSFRKDLPIIAITAFAMNGDETRASEAGCDDYLSKPVSLEKLFEKLKQHGIPL
jgi:CheY-like chemotaxis protein